MAGDIGFDGLLLSFLHTLFKRERKMNFQKSDYWKGITLLLKTVRFIWEALELLMIYYRWFSSYRTHVSDEYNLFSAAQNLGC